VIWSKITTFKRFDRLARIGGLTIEALSSRPGKSPNEKFMRTPSIGKAHEKSNQVAVFSA